MSTAAARIRAFERVTAKLVELEASAELRKAEISHVIHYGGSQESVTYIQLGHEFEYEMRDYESAMYRDLLDALTKMAGEGL